jgi:cyclophilin family peptidyl-prolyl cis-trans isomerase
MGLIDSLVHDHAHPQVLAGCAAAYGLTKQPNVATRLTKLWLNEDPLVRAAAFEQLIVVDSGNVDYHISEALDDSDYVVVYGALMTIQQQQKRQYLPEMQAMMSSKTTDVELRRGILEVAASFLPEENPRQDTLVMQILIAGLVDPNYVVRMGAAEIYKSRLDEDQWAKVHPVKTRIDEKDILGGLEKYTVNPHAVLVTEYGEIEIELLFDVAPVTVLNFIDLVRDGYYEGLMFHRVIPNFVAQGGDPRGDGWGGPGYSIRCEYSDEPYIRGSLGMATSGKDTGGSQFFICYTALPHLEARYTLFGRVVTGMELVDKIAKGDVIETIRLREGPGL